MVFDRFTLEGKIALVTGAGRGLGRTMAMALAQAGAAVVAAARTESEVQETANAVCDLGRKGLAFSLDVSDSHMVDRLVERIVSELGSVDILVNNAGILREASLAETTADLVDQHFAVNVRGAILVTREALPHLTNGARIINLASELAYVGRQNASVYAASKAAMLGLTRSWARELAPRILVNAVAPGPTDTPLLGFESMTANQQALEITNPLGRIGRPEEIAAAILFLAGPGATFFTGQCIGPNGGAAMT